MVVQLCEIGTSLKVTRVYLRCSDGVDRHRQEWLDYGCPEQVSPVQVT